MSLAKKIIDNDRLNVLNYVCTSRSDYHYLEPVHWKKARIWNWIYLSVIFLVIIMSFAPLYFINDNKIEENIFLKVVNAITLACLVLDYILRWITYPIRIKNNSINPLFFYLFTSSSILMLCSLVSATFSLVVSFLPINLSLIKTAKALSILKIFRLILLLNIIPSFKILTEEFIKNRIIVFNLLSILTLIVLVVALVIFSLETNAGNEYIKTFGDSLYYCFITVSAVGFGDIVCITGEGRILSIFLGVLGTISLSIPFGIVIAAFTSKLKNKYKKYDDIDPSSITTIFELFYLRAFKPKKAINRNLKCILIFENINIDNEERIFKRIKDLIGGDVNIKSIKAKNEKIMIEILDKRKINNEINVILKLLDISLTIEYKN